MVWLLKEAVHFGKAIWLPAEREIGGLSGSCDQEAVYGTHGVAWRWILYLGHDERRSEVRQSYRKKLKEYVAVHFHDQAMVATRTMGELEAPVFTETERPVPMYWSGTSRDGDDSNKTKKETEP